MDEVAAAVGGFVVDGDAWRYRGALTLDNAAQVMAAADALPLPASGLVDLGALAPADSSALAVVMALHRRAQAENRPVRVVNMPAALQSLAVVYGVDDLVLAR
jgi:phospholipid transport system transporter-binding protein